MKIKVAGREIEVVARKQNKHLRLRVTRPKGDIKVSCPPYTSLERVEQFVLNNLSWIEKAEKKIALSNENSYLHGGEFFVLFGEKYNIIEVDSNNFSLTLDNGNAILGIPKGANNEDKQNFIKKHYKGIAKEIFPPLVEKYEKVLGVKSSKIGYRFMTSRWGSCNVKTKNINFSVYAVTKPMEYVEYLVCHELMHLIYPNHGNAFKSALRAVIPSADKISKLK